MNRPNQARLQELLHYEADTGNFVRKQSRGANALAGSTAGYYRKDGYIRIWVDNRPYFAHQLAWLYIYGQWPSLCIDHINRNKRDNRIANLRLATISQNQANRGLMSLNTSGVRGVSFNKRTRKWTAAIGIGNDKVKYLGQFPSITEAKAAYELAASSRWGGFFDG